MSLRRLNALLDPIVSQQVTLALVIVTVGAIVGITIHQSRMIEETSASLATNVESRLSNEQSRAYMDSLRLDHARMLELQRSSAQKLARIDSLIVQMQRGDHK